MGAGKIDTKYAAHATLSRVSFFADNEEQRALINIAGLSDKAGSVVTARKATALSPYTLDAAAAAGQKVIPLAATTGLASTDIIVIQQVKNPSVYEHQIIDSVSAGVSITIVTVNLTNSYATGDKVYEMESIGAVACGAAAIHEGKGYPLMAVDVGSPMVVDLDSTSAGYLSASTEMRDV